MKISQAGTQQIATLVQELGKDAVEALAQRGQVAELEQRGLSTVDARALIDLVRERGFDQVFTLGAIAGAVLGGSSDGTGSSSWAAHQLAGKRPSKAGPMFARMGVLDTDAMKRATSLAVAREALEVSRSVTKEEAAGIAQSLEAASKDPQLLLRIFGEPGWSASAPVAEKLTRHQIEGHDMTLTVRERSDIAPPLLRSRLTPSKTAGVTIKLPFEQDVSLGLPQRLASASTESSSKSTFTFRHEDGRRVTVEVDAREIESRGSRKDVSSVEITGPADLKGSVVEALLAR